MKNLLTKENLMFVGIGIATAFVVYKVLVNRDKSSANEENDFSNFAGNCTCANGFKGYCATNCATCCSRIGGVAK